MLHYVHQLAVNFACHLVAGQVVYGGFLEGFFAENSCLQHLKAILVRVKQNSKVMGCKTKTMS